MEKFFKVAGHLFSAKMADDCVIADMIPNYAPFVTEEKDGSLFSIEVVDCLDTSGAELVFNDDAGDVDAVRTDIYKAGADWLVRLAVNKVRPICAEFIISGDYSRTKLRVLGDVKKCGRFAFDNAMMLTFAFRTAFEDTLEMHSSVTVKDGKGYMFLGKSGTGKSTHSSLWIKNLEGCFLLNDDNPVVRVVDGVVRVYGSPWSGKTPCYINKSAQVGAVVDLAQAPVNHIERLSNLSAYAALYSSCSGFKAEKAMADALHSTMEKVVLGVPFYHLDCLPDREAAEICCKEVTVNNHED